MWPSSDAVDYQQSLLQRCGVSGGAGATTLTGDPSMMVYGASSGSERKYEPLGFHDGLHIPWEDSLL